MNFPKHSNGYQDNGEAVGTKSKCPNCNSNKYTQTISIESCSDCGLLFDYWSGAQGNDVYNKMIDRQARIESQLEYKRQRELEREEDERSYLDDEYDCSGGW